MTDRVECTKCNGKGLLKIWWPKQWIVVECDRCKGFGVDPNLMSGKAWSGSSP